MKWLLCTISAVGLLALQSYAQTGNASATVTLTVSATVTVTNVRGLNFGTHVQDSTAASVNPNTGGTNAAYFTLQTSANHASTVTYTHTSMASGSNTINWTPSVVGADNSASQSTAGPVTSGGSITTNSSGFYYFWVGGTTDVITNSTPPGTYTGTFTLTVAY
jgi:hypothetical protein